jgi:uncharacterized protein (DUF4415 family)/uncharacterized DUF497 family protein
VKISFDASKSERNAAESALPFELAAEFDFESAVIWIDGRFDYPETRWIAIRWLRERLHVVLLHPYRRRNSGDQSAQGERPRGEEIWQRETPLPPLTDEEGEVRELRDEDFARGLRFDQLPPEMQAKLRRPRGKQKAPTKALISLRVSRDVLGRFRATGEGWQTRMDEALREWIERREAKGR